MRTWVFRILILVVLAVVGFWAWRTFFPDPKKVIKNDLQQLASLLSFAPNEGQLAKAANANKAAAFFTPDIEIVIDVTGYGRATLSGRDDLFQKLLAARTTLSALKVDFVDINVSLGPNRESAEVDLTAKAQVPGERDFQFQELKMSLKMIDRRWLIRKVETVKTVS